MPTRRAGRGRERFRNVGGTTARATRSPRLVVRPSIRPRARHRRTLPEPERRKATGDTWLGELRTAAGPACPRVYGTRPVPGVALRLLHRLAQLPRPIR